MKQWGIQEKMLTKQHLWAIFLEDLVNEGETMGNTDFLFARPSFLEGVGRVLDIGSTLQEYNKNVTPEEADTLALFKDFQATGNDIRSAMREFDKTLK